MRARTLGVLVFAGLALLVAASGAATAADPGHHEVQITNGSGDVNASYYYDSSAGSINVTEDGGSTWTNSTLSNPNESAIAIQWAIDNSSIENDTILVGPGTYNGSVVVQFPVTTLDATEGPSQTVLKPISGEYVGIHVTRENAVVRNFTVTEYSSSSNVGIDVDSANVTVVDNVVESNLVGIDDSSLVSGESSYLNNTVVDNLDNGVQIKANRTTLRGNRVENNSGHGIVLRDHDNSSLWGNDVRLNDLDGIHVNNSDDNTLESNTVIGNGVDYGDNGIEISNGSDWNLVTNSTVESNYDVGVFVDGSKQTAVRNNTIRGEDGIEATAPSEAVTAVENWVSGHGDGTRILVHAPNSSVRNNTVIRGSGLVVDSQNATVAGNLARDNNDGIVVRGADHTVANNTATNATDHGMFLGLVSNSTFTNNNASRNQNGVALDEVTNTTLTGTIVNDNQQRGITTTGYWSSHGNLFENTTAQRNGGAAFFANRVTGPANVLTGLDVGASTNAGTTVDVEAKNVSITAVQSAPGSPSNLDSVGRLVNVTNTSAPADSVNLTLHYETGDLDNFDDATLALYDYTGSWTEVSGAAHDAGNNTFSATLTDYDVVGLYAESTSTSSGWGGYFPPPSDGGTVDDGSSNDATDGNTTDDSPDGVDGGSAGDGTETGDDGDADETAGAEGDEESDESATDEASPSIDEAGSGSFPWWLLLLLLAPIGGVSYYYREDIRESVEEYRD